MGSHYLILSLNSLAFILSWLVVIYFYVARKRFLGEDFKRVITWVFYAVTLLAVLFTLLFLNMLTAKTPGSAYTIILEITRVAVMLIFLKSAQEIHKFSKEYGFADVEKKVQKFFG